LDNYNIIFDFQKTYDDCLSNDSNKLRFDFYLPKYNLCIEFDGRQHYISNVFFGGENRLNKTKFNDEIKNERVELIYFYNY
jgi:hypothetical protein